MQKFSKKSLGLVIALGINFAVSAQNVVPYLDDFQSSIGNSFYHYNGEIWHSGSYYASQDALSQIYLSKLDQNLNVDTTYTFESNFNEFSGRSAKVANNVYIVSEYLNQLTRTSTQLRKIDLENNNIDSRIMEISTGSNALKLIDANEQMVVIGGYISGIAPVVTRNYFRLEAYHLDLSPKWEISFGQGEINYLQDLKIVGDKIYVCGDIQIDGKLNAFLAAVDLEGNILWEKIIGDNFTNGTQGLLVENDKIIVVGESTSSFTNPSFDILLIETDLSGNTLRYRYLDLGGSDALFSLVKLGNYYVGVGYSTLDPINFQNKPIAVLFDENFNYIKNEVLSTEHNGIAYSITTNGAEALITGFLSLNFNTHSFVSRGNVNEVFSVNELKVSNNFKMYPNPANVGGNVWISLNSEMLNPTIEFIDLSGKVLSTYSYQGFQKEVFFKISANIAPGLYLVRISDKSQSFAKSILVIR